MSERRVPIVRRPVAVLLSRFPLVTETFVLREVIEMERQGQPVRLVPLLRERPATVHREAVPWIERALYTPFLSWAIAAANLRAFAAGPARYVRLIAEILWGTASRPGTFVRTAALLPKSVYLAERLCAEGIGHVHAHFATYPATAAYVISRLAGIPYSMTVHAHDIFVDRTLLRRKLAAASFVRTISRFNRRYLAERYPDLADRLQVIHVGIDPDRYAPGPRAKVGVPSIVCVAALKPYKGLPVLIEACRRLRNEGTAFHCDIVGEGPQRAELAATVLRARLQDDVHLLGARPQHEVAQLVPGASVFVLPSVVAADGQMEGIPVALMEAMAAGRPVIASALSGIPELIEDGVTGVLVPPGDAARLAGAIRDVLADPARAREMGERARQAVRRSFRLDTVVAELLAQIDEAAPFDAGLAARLASAAAWPCAPVPRLGVRRLHEGDDSMVAELLLPGSVRPAEVALKVHRPRRGESAPPPERARREFEALRRLYASFDEADGFGVPRALRLDGDALAMELCAGTPLDILVRRSRRTRDGAGLGDAMGRVGGWLRVFQAATEAGGSAADAVDRVRTRARLDLEGCAARGMSPMLVHRLSERLDDFASEARSAAGPVVARHGDFWPGNVYVADGGVQVIDFEGIGEGQAAEDVAYFLVQLELFHSYPGLARAGERMARAFLAGYGSDTLAPSAYALCRTAAALQLLRRTSETTRGWRGWWRRRALRRLLLRV